MKKKYIIDRFKFKAQNLDATFWDEQYVNNNTIWDLGNVSPPLKAYFDQINNKEISILIPGAGNAYELDYLLKLGFKNITILDISNEVIERLKLKHIEYEHIKFANENFFNHNGGYDLIIEQTFFCAIHPNLKEEYVNKMSTLLKKGGKLVGVFFGVLFDKPGPPFGGEIDYYRFLFESRFQIKTLSPCYNSIKPRIRTELFAIFVKN